MAASLLTSAFLWSHALVTNHTLGDRDAHVVSLLVNLVTKSIFGRSGTGGERCVVVLRNLFVGLLAGGRLLALDGLRDVVRSVPEQGKVIILIQDGRLAQIVA